jgi:hypothetical protein
MGGSPEENFGVIQGSKMIAKNYTRAFQEFGQGPMRRNMAYQRNKKNYWQTEKNFQGYFGVEQETPMLFNRRTFGHLENLDKWLELPKEIWKRAEGYEMEDEEAGEKALGQNYTGLTEEREEGEIEARVGHQAQRELRKPGDRYFQAKRQNIRMPNNRRFPKENYQHFEMNSDQNPEEIYYKGSEDSPEPYYEESPSISHVESIDLEALKSNLDLDDPDQMAYFQEVCSIVQAQSNRTEENDKLHESISKNGSPAHQGKSVDITNNSIHYFFLHG